MAIGVRIFLLTAFLLALGASSAAAAPRPPVDFSFKFDSARPGAQSDARMRIFYRDPEDPDNPDPQPPALTKVIIAAPRGTVFNGAAVTACTASNEELMAAGKAACPPDSNVGGGFGSVVNSSGPPMEPFVSEVTLFNYRAGIIELLEFAGGGFKAVDRARFDGPSTMVLNPAVIPGITEREFSFTYRGRGRFITTPPTCPSSGVWRSRITYTVTTGATYTAPAVTPCSRTGSSRPRIRASVRPRRARVGRRVRVRVRLRSSVRRCVSRALVRVGSRSFRTGRAGRATIRTRFGRRGRRRVLASKRGCKGGRTRITVLRRR